MWDRKELKEEAKTNLKRNYWIVVLVCMLMAFMFAEYGDSFYVIKYYNDSYKAIQKANKPKNYKKGANRATTQLEDILKGAGVDFNKEGGLDVVANKGNLSGIVRGLQEKRGIEYAVRDLILKWQKGASGFEIAIGMLAVLFNLIFVLIFKSVLLIGERRFFLENRTYHETRFNRIFFLFKEKNIINPSLVMFMMNLFLSLWMLTIVGYFIKLYSYRMVPYILAENPDIKWKQAIKLSRDMMYGNKWKSFVFDISFWYWHLLRLITVGLVGIFFFNPYYTAAETELYRAIREEAREKELDNIQLLNDEILFLPQNEDGTKMYPGVVSHHPADEEKKWDRNYKLVNLILIFFTFALVGWLWEVSLHLVKDHVFVNRGTMFGPWLPIYGFGGTFVLIVLKKIRDRPVLTFIMTFILCGILEYATSWFLEYTKGTKWWDYSGYLLNINGRVCMEGLLIFAIAGSACIYLIAPFFDDLYNKLSVKTRWILAAILLACFGVDMVYSHFHPNTGEGITDYGYLKDEDSLTGGTHLISGFNLSDLPRL